MGSEALHASTSDRQVPDRERIKQELARVALGEVEGLSGRALQARVSALRCAERATRDEHVQPPEPVQERADYPVDDAGRFDPSCDPAWWPLRLNWRWEAGDEREGEAIERWRHSVHRVRWEAGGKRWARSEWAASPSAWTDALAALST